MTEGQRDYLADLALCKGVVLEDTDNKSVAWASKKIDELKAMDDAEFLEPTPEFSKKITATVDNIIKGDTSVDFSEITLDVAGDINKAIAAILHEGISPDKKIELVADVLKQTGRELHGKLYSLSSEVFGSAAMLSGGYGAEMADQAERLAVKIVRNSALNRQTAAMLLKEYCDVALATAQHEAFKNAKSMQKHPTLTRRANVGKPDCAWCQKKAGVYVNPTSDDFKRHHKCDCVFEVSGYNSRNGVLKNFKKG